MVFWLGTHRLRKKFHKHIWGAPVFTIQPPPPPPSYCMFKHKTSKKRVIVTDASRHATLDARHQEVISTLQEKLGQHGALLDERDDIARQAGEWQQRIVQLKGAGEYDTPEYDLAWTCNLALQDRLADVSLHIQRQEACEEEIGYYENTGHILLQYYDLLSNQGAPTDGGQQHAQHVAHHPLRSGRKKQPPPPKKNILDAFGCGGSNVSDDAQQPQKPAPVNKIALVDEYISRTDSSFVRPLPVEALGVCLHCKTELVCLQQEGTMVCPGCGYQELLLIEQNRPMLRQLNKETSHQSYRRINHFREWCSQIQGRELTDIPEEVFEMILQELKKEKISDPKKITYAKMREICKRLRINRFYEHINYIIRRICNVATPYFSPELEEKLCMMFKEVQGCFIKHCPPNRKNFLSYSYLLFKLFQILGQQDKQYLDYCKYFTLLKSREKLYAQDQIFRAICIDLGWPVIPTL